MSPFVRAGALAALSLLCAAPAAAQTAPSPLPSTPPEIGHVSTSDRHDEPIEATAKTTYVVTKNEIVRRGYATVASALENLPGVVVYRAGPIGAQTGVALRGTGTNQTLVLLDGRPVAGAQIGNVDLGAMPTAGVERIEVVEGGGATLYGTGAVGGVVNIITSASSRATSASISSGTSGERAVTFETPSFVFERRITNGAFAYPAIGADPAGERSDVDLSSTAVRARTAAHLGDIALGLDAGVVSRRLGAPGEVAFATPNARQEDVSGDARATFSRDTAHAELSLDLTGTRQTLVYRDPVAAESYTGQPIADLNVESRLQASLRNVVRNQRGALVYGIDLAHGVERIDAGDGAPPSHGFAQTGLYAQDQVRFGDAFRAYAGVRAERDGGAGGTIAPSIGGVLQLSDAYTLRANASTGFRAPTGLDLYYPGFSNPALRPERTKNADVTLTDSRVLGGASVGWFVTAGNNLIVPTDVSVANVEHAVISGLTFDVRTRPFHGFTTAFNLTDTYRAQDLTVSEQRLARRPVLVSNVELAYTGSPRARLAAAGVSAHTAGDDADPFGSAPGYTRIDAYVRLRLAPRAVLSLRAYDLGNERYEEIGGYPMPGRSFTLELSTH